MLPSSILTAVKNGVKADKIVEIFDEYTKKVKYPSFEIHQNILLCYAVDYGNLDLVKLLKRKGADVNFHDNRRSNPAPLHVACQSGNSEMIKLLLDFGADVQMVATCIVDSHGIVKPNTRGIPKTAMEVVLFHDDPSLMALLLPYYEVTRDLERQNVLHIAAIAGAYDCIYYLLNQKDTKVNELDAAGRSALYHAVQHESRLVELLLIHGADPNTVTLGTKRDKGSTALHHLVALLTHAHSHAFRSNFTALQNGEFLIKLKLLLDSGANINAILTDGHTVLSLLCYNALNLMGNYLRKQEFDQSLLVVLTETVCQAIKMLFQHGARVEIKHGVSAFRILWGEAKKMFTRIRLCQSNININISIDQKQKVLDSLTDVLKLVAKFTEIMIQQGSTKFSVLDLKFILSTRTNIIKHGIRMIDLHDLNWTEFETVYSEICRLTVLGTEFSDISSNADDIQDTDHFVDTASFPLVLEKVTDILPRQLYTNVMDRVKTISTDENSIDTSCIESFICRSENVLSLKKTCRCKIFHCLKLPRLGNITVLALPGALKRYVALEF